MRMREVLRGVPRLPPGTMVDGVTTTSRRRLTLALAA